MNKQGNNLSRGIEWTDYTWNPVAGCMHGCRWTMPDGQVARCYAESVAVGVAQRAYPQGFAHHYWYPERLDEPSVVKTPSKIFLDSMSDLMGHWVTDDQIRQVLKVCEANPHHTFQLLTKQPPRLLKFDFPPNVWVGVSAPPSQLMGRAVNDKQRRAYVSKALDVLSQINVSVRWMSIEPLSYNIAFDFWHWHFSHSTSQQIKLPVNWAVVGAATHYRKTYQPQSEWVSNVLSCLDGTPIFFKGNLRGNPAASPWREEFPAMQQKSPAAVETTGL